jgi:ATP-dependent DNA helicase RecQ
MQNENTALTILTKYWGYKSFRSFQAEAISSILDSRDTLTVLPTGGGKSICFQVPALMRAGMAVVISPLISLMKDQVDYLKNIGINAECLNSSFSLQQNNEIISQINAGQLKFLYLAPERLMLESMRQLLRQINVSFFVIDEAHCISHWGHDFRADYRTLGILKQEFPDTAVHAFTATATRQVQEDIIKQLKLNSPHLYIGNIDRPNLTYRIQRRGANLINQIVEVIKQKPNEAGIIYCLRRDDVDTISQKLNSLGYKNLPYHAGMPNLSRKKNQDEFSQEKTQIMVATIAFGMGIDRSNIRYIIHAAMPKSIEHYQQETGRAGRDGLPADCYMFYSGSDYRIWEFILRESSQQPVMLNKLKAQYNFCGRPGCRHRYLSNYFSQEYKQENCQACDYCLGEFTLVEQPLELSRKILSCVEQVNSKFGAGHITDILRGNLTENIQRWNHQTLAEFGALSHQTKMFIRQMIEQLVEQRFLSREPEYQTLFITASGKKIFSGEIIPLLATAVVGKAKKEIGKKTKAKHQHDWADIDTELFELLRIKRRQIAEEKNVPAFVIFGDKTLKDMAKTKPVTLNEFADIFGVGETKLQQYGAIFTKIIKEYLF